MGMFDTVSVKCDKCGAYFEEQSKGGECILAQYSIHNAPIEVIRGIGDRNGIIYCPECGTAHAVHIMFKAELVPIQNTNDDGWQTI